MNFQNVVYQLCEGQLERNWVFATDSNVLIPIALQPNIYFKL